jgi:uncharacterized protein HemX
MRFRCGIFVVSPLARNKLTAVGRNSNQVRIHVKTAMIGRIVLVALVLVVPVGLSGGRAAAQDVPGIEICTVEKTMERRTSCLQSNVDFLQKTISKLAADHRQKLDAANRQVEALKGSLAALQKTVDDLQAAQKKAADEQKKAAPPAKDAPAAKEGGK